MHNFCVGHQVVSLVAKTKEQLDLLRSLRENIPDLDFWTEPSATGNSNKCASRFVFAVAIMLPFYFYSFIFFLFLFFALFFFFVCVCVCTCFILWSFQRHVPIIELFMSSFMYLLHRLISVHVLSSMDLLRKSDFLYTFWRFSLFVQGTFVGSSVSLFPLSFCSPLSTWFMSIFCKFPVLLNPTIPDLRETKFRP